MTLRKILRATSQGGGTLETQRGHRINLLDAPDLNLGSYSSVPAANRNNVPQGPRSVRLLDLSCDGRRSQLVTITIACIYEEGWPQDITPRTNMVGGPVTGIIEFGNGSSFSRVEFDVPSPSCTPSFHTFADEQLTPLIGSVSVPICASSIRVYARNDATVALLGYHDMTHVPPRVIGFYINSPSEDYPIVTKEPKIGAFVGYGPNNGGNSHLFKTIYIGTLDASPGSGSSVDYVGIPAYARYVRILCDHQSTASFTLTFDGMAAAQFQNYSIIANSILPVPIPPGAARMFIVSNTAEELQVLALFELVI
jgi:hypothetical protein